MFDTSLISFDNCPSMRQIYGTIEAKLSRLCTDTRSLKDDCVFIALAGENFDAHKFIPELINKNISIIVYNQEKYSEEEIISLREKSTTPLTFVACTDTEKFLQELATSRIKKWKELSPTNIVIGITGSNGKTTNKEMLKFLLEKTFPDKIHSTKGNLNNHLGVPFTILDLEDHHKVAIIEMGTNHIGEIEILCDMATPTAGLITNIGSAHLEFFKTEENIYKEKSSLFKSVVSNTSGLGHFVANKDDPFLKKLEKCPGLIFFGTNAEYILTLEKHGILLDSANDKIKIKNQNIREQYNFINLAQSFLLAYKLFPQKRKEFVRYAEEFKLPSMNRSQWVKYRGIDIFLDAYNANPTSMKTSLTSFVNHMNEEGIDFKNCLFILGDMNELGEATESLHSDISKFAQTLGVKNVVAVGHYHGHYAKGFSAQSISEFKRTSDLKKKFDSYLKGITHVYVKGSRSLKLETLLENVP